MNEPSTRKKIQQEAGAIKKTGCGINRAALQLILALFFQRRRWN
jgi:hypothetical protein